MSDKALPATQVGLARPADLPPATAFDEQNPALVAELVASAFRLAGLAADGGRPLLSNWIGPGATVLVKPNWVLHRNEKRDGDTSCLYTSHAITAEVIRQVAACQPGRLIVGDAPVQGCSLEQVVPLAAREAFAEAAGGGPLEFADFRYERLTRLRALAPVDRVRSGRDESDYVLFDLAADSLLEPLNTPAGRYRVAMYDPRALARTHQPGRHQYLMAREVQEADVIITVPKLKTHKKTGLTAALKGFVGTIGRKDYLPHHRLGGERFGGDCYPGGSRLLRAAEFCLDQGNQVTSYLPALLWLRSATVLRRLASALGQPWDLAGSWSGNDTCWRMVLDIHRLVVYGRVDGTVADEPQRHVLSLVDANVAGQGDGPLAPEPLPLGCLLAGSSAAAVDWVGGLLLGLEPSLVPLLAGAFTACRWPLAVFPPEAIRVVDSAGAGDPLERLAPYARPARLPLGWAGACDGLGAVRAAGGSREQ